MSGFSVLYRVEFKETLWDIVLTERLELLSLVPTQLLGWSRQLDVELLDYLV